MFYFTKVDKGRGCVVACTCIPAWHVQGGTKNPESLVTVSQKVAWYLTRWCSYTFKVCWHAHWHFPSEDWRQKI